MTQIASPLLKSLTSLIETSDNFLPFDVFMQHALYHQPDGYYQQGEVFGSSGDFITAPDMGPWLSLAFADLIHHSWQQMGSPQQWGLLEQGGGRGRLLSQVVRLLEEHFHTPPSQLFAVEKSAYWCEQQTLHYQQSGINVIQREHLDELSTDMPLVIFSNELPDAFPVRCFAWQHAQYIERGISLDETGQLIWQLAQSPMDAPPIIDGSIIQTWSEGYISEYNPSLIAWQQSLGRLLSHHGGVVLTLDYGYSQQEYYRSNRIEGTLMGHRAHQVVDDVLTYVGEADMTAHIDFTTLARIGIKHDLTPTGYLSQGGWLASSPLVQSALQELAAAPTAQSMRLIAHAKRLMLPHAGMGESFKLLIQSTSPMDLAKLLQTMNRLQRLNID